MAIQYSFESSYHHLPFYLVFGYFPEDNEISTQKVRSFMGSGRFCSDRIR